jgi:hypothetical protein
MSLGLRLTPHLGLVKVTAYSDSDWGGCPYTMKSTTGFVIYVNGAPVDWGSQRQKLITQSTAEAEIIALNETVRRVAYVRNILLEFVEVETPSKVHIDNEACRLISTTSTCCSGRTRHIYMRLMCVREMVANGVVEILRVPTNLNPADGHTKALTGRQFRQFRFVARWFVVYLDIPAHLLEQLAICTCVIAFWITDVGMRGVGNVRQSRTTVAYDSHVRRTGSTDTIASSWRQLAVLNMVSYKIPVL